VTSLSDAPALDAIAFLPYLDAAGQIAAAPSGTIGAYAIFDRERCLQYVGYSRDIATSLKQHLARCPEQCYWVKIHAIERPSRQVLEGTRSAWLAEQKATPPGNGEETERWTQPIDATAHLSATEREQLARSDDLDRRKLLKNAARRLEAKVKAALEQRGVRMDMRFNPKLKERGLLDLQ